MLAFSSIIRNFTSLAPFKSLVTNIDGSIQLLLINIQEIFFFLCASMCVYTLLLYNPEWFRTCYPPAAGFQVLGLHVYHHTCQKFLLLFLSPNDNVLFFSNNPILIWLGNCPCMLYRYTNIFTFVFF